MLVDGESDLPLYFPNLYITTQVRNRSLSYSAMESALSGISVLMRFMDEKGENLGERFHEGRLFCESELDAIRDFSQIKIRTRTKEKNSLFTLSELQEFDKNKWS